MLNSLDKSNANFNAKIHLVSTWHVTATTNFQAHKIVKEAEESTLLHFERKANSHDARPANPKTPWNHPRL